ncbi:MAG TPA: imidazole glycerol phosphate synthase subunit HisH [Blastocatellia bacterium]|nr:imidazole glycerol phosphate synthase subunit HisH [Blastocatellia bacterium]
MITIVNYGIGNVQAIANIYKRLNIEVSLAASADELAGADKIILPGVGAFDWAMTGLNQSGMREALDELVITKRKPVLGICVGMQMMGNRSEEGVLDGLGWIDGDVNRFQETSLTDKIRLPQMGWNDVVPKQAECLFQGMESEARFYFLHSYYFSAKRAQDVLAVTDYNGPFASAVRSDNIFGVQFHPEKSHQWGIRLLKNFAELQPC